jgi:hypothetical protein
MHRPSASDELSGLEPMKVAIKGDNSVDSSSPEQFLAALHSQQKALASANAQLLHENMLMRAAQGWQNSMSYAHPGVCAPPGLFAPPPWGAPPVKWQAPVHQDGTINKPSRNSRKKAAASAGNKISKVLVHNRPGDHEVASDSTVSGGSGTASPSMTDDEEGSKETAVTTSLSPVSSRTTVMMRNLPNNLDRRQLLQLMNQRGFQGRYNLVYLPMDFKSRAGLGYAFIDFQTNEDAESFFGQFQGFDQWTFASDKVCKVSWSIALQGIDEHLSRYRNSPVMHESIPDEFKPVLFKDGERVPFPEPTKRIRAPRDWSRRP